MSEINLQISVSHLTQVDRLQSDTHRLPMVHQLQNAQTADDEMNRRTIMPVEPDGIEEKSVDPEAKKDDRGSRRKKKRQPAAENTGQTPGRCSGASFIDVTV